MKKEDIRVGDNLINRIDGRKVKVLFVASRTVVATYLDGDGFPTPDEFCLVWESWEKVCDHEFIVRPMCANRSISWHSIVGVRFCPMCGKEIYKNV